MAASLRTLNAGHLISHFIRINLIAQPDTPGVDMTSKYYSKDLPPISLAAALASLGLRKQRISVELIQS